MEGIIRFCLENRLVVIILILILAGWGLAVAPFDWNPGFLTRDPVPVDAIPDIGENQQIVFTEWPGRSPQDIEDQITYPLSVSLLGVPGVKTIRSNSMFGFSSIYVIFEDDIDFYWARSRLLESLNALPARDLPEGVKPILGPDATALGQVFWYTLEGFDDDGNPAGGWDLHELRTIQDFHVRYALLAIRGVSEVASVGGFVREYQVDVDPDRMRYYGVDLEEVVDAVRRANVEVGARTIEINRVEYLVRGLGFVKNLGHLENALIRLSGDTPIMVRHVASVTYGPAERRGALDKGGIESVGGVVVVRYGENPLAVINRVKKKIEEISPGLPRKQLENGQMSKVRVVPFYDRTGLIYETLGTLRSALSNEMLLTIIVILVMMVHLRSSALVSSLLPLAVLLCFIAMKVFGVDANIVALSGIAIAIGTIVDMGIIVTESIVRHMNLAGAGENRKEVIVRATRQVGGAVLTAVSTTIVSFLPVFTMAAAEGKLFRPLAFTKTFALFASIIVALFVIPSLASLMFTRKGKSPGVFLEAILCVGGVGILFYSWLAGLALIVLGILTAVSRRLPEHAQKWLHRVLVGAVAVGVGLILAKHWTPLGPEQGEFRNFLFVVLIVGIVLGAYGIFHRFYPRILGWCLRFKMVFLLLPVLLLLAGGMAWRGSGPVLRYMPEFIRNSAFAAYLQQRFPGMGREFLPPLDEGSYLYMPVTMPHASIGEVLDILQRQDRAIQAIPEVRNAVGKLGRAESPLDPAPVSMIETVIDYFPRYLGADEDNIGTYRYDSDEKDLFRNVKGDPVAAPDGEPYFVEGRFVRDDNNLLIPDPKGRPFRLWRPRLNSELNPGRDPWDGVQHPDDIWNAILEAAELPGVTVAPKLQPISARIVMLQSGIRAAMGVKVSGADLRAVEEASLEIEKLLREIRSIDPLSVIADRIVSKPYLEIEIDRENIAQHGIDLKRVQDVIEIAIGGRRISTSVEGRERYPIRVRYMRELRDDFDSIGNVLVPAVNGTQIPLSEVAEIRYVPGPQMIKSENTFITGYVLFDKEPGFAETDVVEQARDYLLRKVDSGELNLPEGVSFSFTGNYENQVRADRTLKTILPLALAIIFIILYLQFRSVSTSALVFSSVAVAWAGGFIMIWLYAQPWFLNFSLLGTSISDLFQVHTINLSVAVWVGFLALFGIASDDGVVMATYLEERFGVGRAESIGDARRMTLEASLMRVRPCLMTTATTILALIPVLTSRGRGSDIMVPMAIPVFGGMVFEVITMLVVPVLYCMLKEHGLKK